MSVSPPAAATSSSTAPAAAAAPPAQAPSPPAAAPAAGAPAVALDEPSLYINRELSWLEFNQRVLDEACDSSVPLLERVKFVAISASNLDEFFMVRVAGVKQQLAGGVVELPADGLTPAEQLTRVSQRAQRMVADQYKLFREQLRPGLEAI